MDGAWYYGLIVGCYSYHHHHHFHLSFSVSTAASSLAQQTALRVATTNAAIMTEKDRIDPWPLTRSPVERKSNRRSTSMAAMAAIAWHDGAEVES